MTASTEPLGFQLIEIMGHQRSAGWVEPRVFGGAVLLHVTMPAGEPEERVLDEGIWIDNEYCRARRTRCRSSCPCRAGGASARRGHLDRQRVLRARLPDPGDPPRGRSARRDPERLPDDPGARGTGASGPAATGRDPRAGARAPARRRRGGLVTR